MSNPKGDAMAICNIFETPGRTPADLERIAEHLRTTGPVPPEGCRLVLLGGEYAITVWDTEADRDTFVSQRLRPAYEATGLPVHTLRPKQFVVDTLIAGDLVGAAS
jgi:hypothetical protein